jgi:hypothetical protein
MPLAPEVAAMLAVAVVERHARLVIGAGLAEAHADTIAGRRLDEVAGRIVDVAADALSAADVCAPCRSRPPLERSLHTPPRPTWPAAPSPPRVPDRVELLRARAQQLLDVGAPVRRARQEMALSKLTSGCAPEDLDRWERLLLDLEVEWFDAGAPFTLAGTRIAG